MQLPAPAYAIALYPADQSLLYASEIWIGLESDRQHILATTAVDRAYRRVWHAWDFGAAGDDEPQLEADEQFVRVRDELRAQLQSEGHLEPSRYVLRRAAKALAALDPIRPVTSDFVVYVHDDRYDEGLVEDIRFSGSPAAVAQLEQKRLLPVWL